MDALSTVQRLVIKVGSALLVEEATGAVQRSWLDSLADDIKALRAAGKQVIVVTSGAVGLGRHALDLGARMLRLEEKQAAAAAGQIRLAHAYQDSLARHAIPVAQVLLTLEDTEDRRRYLNARETLDTLLGLGAVPVINENDTVTTAEIRVGDNDRLAARVAAMTEADVLVLLSDIDGLYTADPRKDQTARHMPTVTALTPEILAMAGDAGPGVGTGGMVTKLEAARICMSAGCAMVITKGAVSHPLHALAEGARCTWFTPSATPRAARKTWIASGLKPCGTLTLDAGAVKALQDGKSLLPVGIIAVEGTFARGDAVLLRGPDGAVWGRGLSAYDAADARRIAGAKSDSIASILGYEGRTVMIHRDDMVLDSRPMCD